MKTNFNTPKVMKTSNSISVKTRSLKRLVKFNLSLIVLFITLPLITSSQTITETRNPGAFNKITAGGILNVTLTQGDDHLVEIEATDENMDKVETEVKNGTLTLTMKGSGRNASATVNVTTPEIQEINLSGASSLIGQNEIATPTLKIHVSGASKMELSVNTESLETRGSGAVNIALSGKADYHKFVLSGASQIRAAELETQTTIANASGASNAKVMATDLLDVRASGTSKITYTQRPNSQVMNLSGMASLNDITANDMRTSYNDEGDTVRIRIGSRDVIVVEDEKGKSIRKDSRRKSFRNNWSGVELGINGYLSPSNSFNLTGEAEMIDLRYNKSIAVNLNLWQQNFPLISNNLGLVSGVGIGFNNYRFDNQTRIAYSREGLSFFEDSINNISKNKLTLTWINIPLLLEYQSHGKRRSEQFHLAGGVIFGTRIGTHTKYVYDNSRKRKEKDFHDFHVHPFRLDATGRIGWGKVNLFASYALNTLFKENRGPELYPFTVGIRLVNF
jgi:hypothetical protein